MKNYCIYLDYVIMVLQMSCILPLHTQVPAFDGVLFNLAAAVMKHGDWKHRVLITGTDIDPVEVRGSACRLNSSEDHSERSCHPFSYRDDAEIPVSLINCKESIDLISTLQINHRTKGDYVNLVIYCPSDIVHDILSAANFTRKMNLFYNWLLLSAENNTHIPLHLLKEGDNLVHMMKNVTIPTTYTVERCLSNCYDEGSLQTIFRDLVSVHQVLKFSGPLLPSVFPGFWGRTIDITYAGSKTSLYVKPKTVNGTTQFVGGIEIEVLNVLSDIFNFSYRMTRPPDRKYGVLNTDTGQWTGMIGVLQRGEAELAVGGISVTYQRQEVVDYIYPYMNVENTVFYRTDPSAERSTFFLDAVTAEAWLAILMSPLLVSIILISIIWLDPRTSKSSLKAVDVFTSTCFETYSLLFPQSMGTFHKCKSSALKMILGSYIFMVLIIATLYVGNLIAVLAIPKTRPPFNSIEELAARDDFTLLVDKGSGTQFLRDSNNQKMKLLWEKVQKDPERAYVSSRRTKFIRDNPPGSKIATFDSKSGIDRYMRIYGVCSVASLPGTYFPRGVSIAVRKSTPYLKYFDIAILRMLESGLFERWNEMYFPRQTCYKESAGQRSVTVQDISVLMIMMAVGLAASTAALTVEFCVYMCKRSKYGCA